MNDLFWQIILGIAFIVILYFVIKQQIRENKLIDLGIKKQMKDYAIKLHRKGELTAGNRAFLRREYGEAFLKEVLNSVSQKQRQKQIFTDEFLAIRTAVLKRDGYRCVNCGQTGVELHVHHIVPRSEGGTNDLNNIVTLCARCHSVQDAKGHNLIKEG